MENSVLSSEFKASSELVTKLYQHGISKNYKQGDIILDENSSIRAIPIVMKGMMKVIRTEEDGRVIIHCQSGDRAAIAYSLLRKNGFKDVKNFSGGMKEWLASKGITSNCKIGNHYI